MLCTSLSVLAQPAPLADKLAAQESVALLHQGAYLAVALGQDVVCCVQSSAPSDPNLTAFHQAFGVFSFYSSHDF